MVQVMVQFAIHDWGEKIMKMTELDSSVKQDIQEGWSQKYKSSINCSHPKGFSQKAHCAGKKKHNESVETEMTCPDCGMCKTHGSLNEIAKGAKDSNGVTKCWPGKHAEGTKKGKNGGQVRNCVPNESIDEADMGKHNNATTGFKALAKKAGGGEKGNKIAGAQFQKMKKAGQLEEQSVDEAAKKGLYYNVNQRKKKGISRDADSPKAPSAQAWKDAAKTAKKEGVAEGRRDYDDNRTGFGRGHDHRGLEQELAHETNNYAVSINGKTWKVFGSRQEANRVSNAMERKYPDKKIGVHETGAPISESATLGATSAANVGVGAIYKNKPVSQPKNKNGTAKNALDMKGANLLGGGSIKR